MRKLALFCFMAFLIKPGYAQKTEPNFFQTSNGSFRLSIIAENIVKITFVPNGYTRGEKISDAVILKGKKAIRSIPAIMHGDTLVINNHYKVMGLAGKEANGFRFLLRTQERIMGAGERALPLNRRGYRLNLYNNPWYGYGEGADNLNYSVPFITSSYGYGLFFDNPSKGYLDIGKADTSLLEYGATSGELTAYLIMGNPQQVLYSYHQLTGTQPLPPRWVLGNLMSRFGYTSETQVRDIYSKMRKENIPVDAIIFDLFWFGDSIKGTLGNLDWVNKSKWPDPKKMIDDFKNEGVHTILVTEPYFVETSKNYQASKPYFAVDSLGKPYYLTDFYFGHGGLVDIFRNDAKTWFWQFYKKQMQLGVEAWWGDLGEPERHPADMYHNLKDLGFKRLFSANEVHNIYGHNWTKMLYSYYAKEYPGKRLFSLNRSGFAGSQRYSIFPWTGDVGRNWNGFRAQLPVLLGMSMSGVPYVHSDAGGFAGGEGDKELYVRWLQFAAFTPVFRPHGTALYEVDKAAFSFPSEAALIDEPFRSYAKDAINMRYLLLPYNYTLAWQQAVHGKPLMAPLYFYFANDTTASNVEDEYMWGEELLVAPVLEKGSTQRKIYLPAGNWLNIMTSNVYKGGRWMTIPVNMDFIPVFAKEGAFVPTVSRIKNVAEYGVAGQYLLNYFPSSKKTTYHWFEDDGVSKQSLSGKKFTLINCEGQDLGNRVIVKVKPSNKLYAPRTLAVNTTLAKRPTNLELNGTALPIFNEVKNVKPGTEAFGLWMPNIGSLQVYASFLKNDQLIITITK